MSITPRSRSMRGLAAVSAALVLSLSACGSDDGEIAGTGSDGEASYGEISMQYSWIKNEEFAGEFYAYRLMIRGFRDEPDEAGTETEPSLPHRRTLRLGTSMSSRSGNGP